MRGRSTVAALIATCALTCVDVQAQEIVPREGQVLTFADEVPCPPKSSDPGAVRHLRSAHAVHHPVRRRPRKLVAVVRPPVHKVAVRHHVAHHRPALVHAALSAPPARCTVLRRERLTAASFGLLPEVVELTPVADVIEPGGPTLTDLTSGRPALPTLVNPTAGGGGQPGGVGGVSPAPEPQAWLLMLLGVAALGARLRRRDRSTSRQLRTEAAS